jgi:tetratricopeptide (TPR) repeat protein
MLGCQQKSVMKQGRNMTPTKPLIPWTTRLGTVGESAIKSRLAYFSIPTEYEEDAGIDFYCELIEGDTPSIPFYVQAKGAEHFGSSWGRSIPKSTITYWLQQQHPVFLVVYDDESRTCHWMSIEDHRYSLIQQIFTTVKDTVYVKMDKSNTLEQTRGGNELFIAQVHEDSLSIQLFRGRPQFIGQEYVKKIPSPPRSDAEFHRIRETVRASLYSLVQHYLRAGDLEIAYSYCQFLSKFDVEHYNHFVWFGEIARTFGEADIARESFEQALRICKADKNWPSDSMQEIIAAIEKEVRGL